jgi:hypothetical protein
MATGDSPPAGPRPGPGGATATRPGRPGGADGAGTGWIVETIVSPFHCLYQDALEFHTQSHLRLARSEAEASRLARAALVLYLDAAEALIHQAAAELGRPELSPFVTDPGRPVPLPDVCTLLPALLADVPPSAYDPETPPWPQFAELIRLRQAWTYPGPAASRRAYYRSPQKDASYEPLQPHQVPPGLAISTEALLLPRTGLPRDPYALRPHHLDTARGILDAAVAALDRRLGGALTQNARHRREPCRVVYPGA